MVARSRRRSDRCRRRTDRRSTAAHPIVERSLRLSRHTRIGASGTTYHQLLPTIIAQRITGGEAVRQWAASLRRTSAHRRPDRSRSHAACCSRRSPRSLHRRPAWWFHPLGIETKRARALTEVARHADKLWAWTGVGLDDARRQAGPASPASGRGRSVRCSARCVGDPDAVPVGDYHFPNTVAWALAGEPRADDDRMLELLAPYRGQRGRVLWALVTTAGKAPGVRATPTNHADRPMVNRPPSLASHDRVHASAEPRGTVRAVRRAAYSRVELPDLDPATGGRDGGVRVPTGRIRSRRRCASVSRRC